MSAPYRTSASHRSKSAGRGVSAHGPATPDHPDGRPEGRDRSAGEDAPASAAPDRATAGWSEHGHLASAPYPPDLEAVRAARDFVQSHLRALDLEACADDAGLMVSELAANAVLHARTPFAVHLRPTLEGGVRVEVRDDSALPPVFTAPSATAMSGRGLNLVATMATRWGSHPEFAPPVLGDPPEPVGKIVWFEVEATGSTAAAEASIEDLLALWSDDSDPTGPLAVLAGSGAGEQVSPVRTATGPVPAVQRAGIITSSLPVLGVTRAVVIRDLPVQELLAAKESMDDLLREMQLLLLATPPSGTPLAGSSRPGDPTAGGGGDGAHPELVVAARLDAAAHDFEYVRRQVREQTTRAAVRGDQLVTITLHLPVSMLAAAGDYRGAVDAAERLGRTGQLLVLPEDLSSHAPVLRHYLDEVVRQLGAPPD